MEFKVVHSFFKMSDRKAVIKNADMAEDMQYTPHFNTIFDGLSCFGLHFYFCLILVFCDFRQDAIDCATQALEKYNIEKDIAAFIKKEFDKKYNPTWHAVVGYVTFYSLTNVTTKFHKVF